MTTVTKTNRNFNLSETDFLFLLKNLKKGDESLFEKAFLSHFEYGMNILKKKYSASHENAYDTTMWGILQFRKLLLEDKIAYGNLETYLIRIIVSRYLYTQKKPSSVEFNAEVFGDIPDDVEAEDVESIERLNKAWEKLCDNCRKLLGGYYYDKIQLKELSKQLDDSSPANTRKRKERCIKKLRAYFFNKK